MNMEISALERARLSYEPRLPAILQRGIRKIAVVEAGASRPPADADAIRKDFPKTCGQPLLRFVEGSGPKEAKPLRVGVVLSGGQAPGGHNVIIGLFDALKRFHGDARLFGFRGGPKGILTGKYEELGKDVLDRYRNTGGFDLIGSGRDKIETPEQQAQCAETTKKLGLDGLVVIGGDDSNTNAAVIAEHFVANGIPAAVVGVPKTIDGDMKSEEIEASFGFDTATKLYAELIGNICRDAKSAGKYWHFVKLMGRSASHVTLECALQTRPNVALVAEEVQAQNLSLRAIVDRIAEVVRARAQAGRHYGVVLVPEGLVEFVPEMKTLISELNVILHEDAAYFSSLTTFSDRQEFLAKKLTKESSYVFSYLPARIQRQLLEDRDAHGNVQVSKIDTEQLLLEQVSEQIGEWVSKGQFPGKFQGLHHFLGYEGRCAPPSNFDADYTYALGQVSAALVAFGKTGCMASVRNLVGPRGEWAAGGVPLTSLMRVEKRKGKAVPVVAKALVRLDGGPFRAFAEARGLWEREDGYLYPGPIQYFGPPEVSDAVTKTLALERPAAPRIA